jgi:dephospho-CoA kinase
MIGLTGPMGAGKSTVAAMLRDLGATVLDADAVVRDLQRPGQPGHTAVVDIFGPGVLGEGREIDRRKLAAAVFDDPSKLAALEAAMHPLVVDRVLRTRDGLSARRVLAVEAIKLLTSKIRGEYEEIWVVLASTPTLMPRLRARGLVGAEIERRLANQPSEAVFRAAATVVIENDGDLDAMRARVEREWSRLSQLLSRRTASEVC